MNCEIEPDNLQVVSPRSDIEIRSAVAAAEYERRLAAAQALAPPLKASERLTEMEFPWP